MKHIHQQMKYVHAIAKQRWNMSMHANQVALQPGRAGAATSAPLERCMHPPFGLYTAAAPLVTG